MLRLQERVPFAIVGLGWIGQEVARAAMEDDRVELVAVCDVDPRKVGRDLGEILGEGRLGISILPTLEALFAAARPRVCVVTTTSDVGVLAPTLSECVQKGAHVVTTCEGLADVEVARAQLDGRFDAELKAAGLAVVSTGVNPGFAMDRLPVLLAQVTRRVRRIRVTRVLDAAKRRPQLQAKVGVGLTPSEFADRLKRGEVGHAGLSGSLRLVARGLGLRLERTAEAFLPVIAARPTDSAFGPVARGRVRGVYQVARGYRDGREVITLELTMALGEPAPRDTIDIVGEPPLRFEGEFPGDDCTIAAVLSAVPAVVRMPPGLRSALDLPLEQPEPAEPTTAPNAVRGTAVRERRESLPTPAAKKAAASGKVRARPGKRSASGGRATKAGKKAGKKAGARGNAKARGKKAAANKAGAVTKKTRTAPTAR